MYLYQKYLANTKVLNMFKKQLCFILDMNKAFKSIFFR